jgi:hypothetical protein
MTPRAKFAGCAAFYPRSDGLAQLVIASRRRVFSTP